MYKLFKIELKKIFSNKQIYLSVGIGLLLTIVLSFLQIRDRNIYEQLIATYGTKGELYYPNTVYNSFIGLDYIYLPSVILYTILPILSTLPFAASYFKEKKSGYVKNVFVKIDKKKYYITKFVSVFFSAFITIVSMLLLSLIITMLFFPAYKPELVTSTYTITNEKLMWFDLFTFQPMLYTLAYIFLDAIYYGAITLGTLLISMFTDNKFIVYTGTTILCMAVDYMMKIFNNSAFSPITFLRPIQTVEGINFQYIIISFCLIVVICGVLFIKVEGRKDTL